MGVVIGPHVLSPQARSSALRCARRTSRPRGPSAEQATLHASFSPDRLGAPTTISFGFHLATTEGVAPPPLTAHRPADAGRHQLHDDDARPGDLPAGRAASRGGSPGCPANSRLGYGSARRRSPVRHRRRTRDPRSPGARRPLAERATSSSCSTPTASIPVDAQLAFSGEVLPDTRALRLAASHHRPARRERPRRPRRLDRHRHDARSARATSPTTATSTAASSRSTPAACPSPNTAPHGGFPFAADLHLPGRHAAPAPRRPSPARRVTAPMSTVTPHTQRPRSRAPPPVPVEAGPSARRASPSASRCPYAFASTVLCHLLLVPPALLRELARWQRAALQIPEPELRRLALASLAKRGNIEGAALFATLAPAVHRRDTVHALGRLPDALQLPRRALEQPLRGPVAQRRAAPPGAARRARTARRRAPTTTPRTPSATTAATSTR